MSKLGLRMLLATAVLAAGLSPAGSARAVPIVGDYTLVDVTSIGALTGAGITVSGLGTAEVFVSPALGVALGLFPVTGGDVDLPTSFLGTIEHEGSGLRLSFLGVDLDLTDFVIDTVNNVVNADVAFGSSSGTAAIFDIVPCQSGPPGTCQTLPGGAVIPTAWGLRLTATAAAVIETAFGIPGLAGLQFGVANTALVPIPEPGSALLLGAALAGLGVLRRARP